MAGEAFERGLAYIRDLRQKGRTDDQIREEFRRAGWQDKQVSVLMRHAAPSAPQPGATAPAGGASPGRTCCPYCSSQDIAELPEPKGGLFAWLTAGTDRFRCTNCGFRWGEEVLEQPVLPRGSHDEWLKSRLRIAEQADADIGRAHLMSAMAESDRAWPSHCVYIVDEYCARHGLALPEADFDPDDPADIHSLLNVPDNPLEDEYVLRDGLSEAARADDLSTARALLEDGIHPHAAGSAGYTPLGAAAAAGHYGMVELLLGAGAAADDVGADDESGDEDEDEEPDLYDGLGEDAALHLAAENGHLDVCRLLLDHGASADADGMNRIKPLHGAAQNGHLDVCTLLLARKATPDARDKDDATPLHLAAGNGHVGICALLLKRGARVNVVSRRSQSRPIWVAHLDEWSGETRTYQDGWESPVRENRTPLHYAVAGGHEEIVKLLVERGADASIEDGWGESATDIALDDVHRGRGSEEILDILTAGQR